MASDPQDHTPVIHNVSRLLTAFRQSRSHRVMEFAYLIAMSVLVGQGDRVGDHQGCQCQFARDES